jgi:hypothetical protein
LLFGKEAVVNRNLFDSLTRRAGTTDRKTALKALGGSLATVAAARPLAAAAAKRNCGAKAARKCQRQVAPCQAFWDEVCNSFGECTDHYFACCEHLATCQGAKYFACANVPT